MTGSVLLGLIGDVSCLNDDDWEIAIKKDQKAKKKVKRGKYQPKRKNHE